jgi:hypothetical protein
MDFFYDGQIRRYVTQFMRFFIGFKYKAGDGEERHVPVMYGDLTRQVASIIRDNSENKMPTVPRIACYITGLELDMTRLSDATFVSKINIRERKYSDFDEAGDPIYESTQGGHYTIERLMPTPYKLSMKADIWTSNTDQKLQLLEQILVFFNPSFEIETTDNFVDWTSLSVVNLKNLTFSSRTIPQAAESDIDICSIEFDMPIFITAPAKVKKLGVVKNIVTNIFTEDGDVLGLEDLTMDLGKAGTQLFRTYDQYGVLLLKSNNGQSNDYDLSILDVYEAVQAAGLDVPVKYGDRLDWNLVLEHHGGYTPGLSMVYFLQPNGNEIRGTFTINQIDPTYLVVTIEDKPSNTSIPGPARSNNSWTTIDAIIDPYKFNPIEVFGSASLITPGIRYLMLEDVNPSENRGGVMQYGQSPADGSSGDPYDGPDGWKDVNGYDLYLKANSIIEWDGTTWVTVFDPAAATELTYVTNLKTGIQYKWDLEQWLKSFEGEYAAGTWRFNLDGE